MIVGFKLKFSPTCLAHPKEIGKSFLKSPHQDSFYLSILFICWKLVRHQLVQATGFRRSVVMEEPLESDINVERRHRCRDLHQVFNIANHQFVSGLDAVIFLLFLIFLGL